MTARRSLLLLTICFALAAQPKADLTLSGTVLNAQTGEPVKRAQVHLMHFGPFDQPGEEPTTAPPAPWSATTFTDASGIFHFNSLPAGQYMITASKPEFTQKPDSDSANIHLTASKEDVALRLSPLGVITGTVADETGEPLRGVTVRALQTRMEDGWRRTSASRTVSTDDRGIYRLWNLQSGKYFIKATGWSGGTYSYVGDTAPQMLLDDAFAPTYAGGGQELDSATPVAIEAGTEARVDISLHLRTGYRVRGSLSNFAAHHAVRMELLSGDEDVSPSRVSMNGDTGSFEIQAVVPGSYLLRATQDQASATVPLNVGDGDVDGLALPLAPAVDVPISVHFTSPPPRPPRNDDSEEDGPAGEGGLCNVALSPPGRESGLSHFQSYDTEEEPALKRAGPRVLKSVMPGSYRVSVVCFGGYAHSVVSGTQDLIANPILTIPPNAPSSPIEILASYGGGTITGTLPAADAEKNPPQVLVVPQSSGGAGPLLVVPFRPQGEGSWRFTTQPLPPGSYSLYAFPSTAEIEFRNPQFLEALHGGASAQVAAEGSTQVSLTEVTQ